MINQKKKLLRMIHKLHVNSLLQCFWSVELISLIVNEPAYSRCFRVDMTYPHRRGMFICIFFYPKDFNLYRNKRQYFSIILEYIKNVIYVNCSFLRIKTTIKHYENTLEIFFLFKFFFVFIYFFYLFSYDFFKRNI